MTAVGLEQHIAELVATLVREQLAKHAAPDPSGLVSIERAARRLDVSISLIRKAIREKRLPSFRVGSAVRVRVADVDALAIRATADDPAEQRRERVLKLARGGRPEDDLVAQRAKRGAR